MIKYTNSHSCKHAKNLASYAEHPLCRFFSFNINGEAKLIYSIVSKLFFQNPSIFLSLPFFFFFLKLVLLPILHSFIEIFPVFRSRSLFWLVQQWLQSGDCTLLHEGIPFFFLKNTTSCINTSVSVPYQKKMVQ